MGERAKGVRAMGERAKGERAMGERAMGERAKGKRGLQLLIFHSHWFTSYMLLPCLPSGKAIKYFLFLA